MERRSNPVPVRLDTRQSEAPKIRGVAARYYDPADSGTQFELWPGAVERILPGAFDRAAKKDDVVALFNHDASLVLGRRSAKTLKLFNRQDGLHYTIEPPATDLGRDLQESIRRGDVRGSSFGFIVRSAEWIKEDGVDVRLLKEVSLFDVSPVTFPAYTGTSVDVRSRIETREPIEARASWEAWHEEETLRAEKLLSQRHTDHARLRLAQLV